jgi:serine/threonine protein kinase/tetratricopeptide (TPR) repeat protein
MEGRQFAAYDIQEKLGAGGMGAVYRASDRRIGRIVAIKIIRPDNVLAERARERFAREARSIGALNHPNIATLHDVSLSGDTPFIVMEYLPGGSLRERMGQGPFRLPEILRLAIQIATGLEHAHAHGVIHRDLKPANILFSAEGTAKIIDFGLALMPDSTELTQPGAMMGTAEYMSPEQACGKVMDLRSDIFSFGVILYHMAAGHNPFSCPSIPATLHRIAYEPVPPLESVRPDFPAALTRLTSTLIEKRPEDRPSLTSVVRELRSLETSLDSGATETLISRQVSARTFPHRWPAALLLLVIILAAGWWFRNRRLHPDLPATRQLIVLPFDSLNHDPLEQAFCDGLVELLTSSLTQMERFHKTLWVIPSADVRRLQLHDVSEARKAFPVNLAVTGSLQTDGGQILVILNLSDASTTRQIASRIIPVSATERAQLMPRLTSALLDMLNLDAGVVDGDVLRGAQSKVQSAYDSYLQGKGFLQHAEVPANVDRAIDVLERSVALDPTFAMAQATLADAYLRRYTRARDKEWLAKADQMVHQSLNLDGRQAFVHLILGRVCRATGQLDQAISEIQQAISMDPLNVSAYTNLALVYADAGRPADAEKAYLQAIRIRPGYWPAYSNLGVFYELRGEYAKALEPLSLAVKLAPEYAEGHNTLGSLFYYMQRFDDALAEFDRALSLRPTALTYSNRGDIYRLRGDYAAAQEDYRRALELDKNNPLIWGNLAMAVGQLPDAANRAADAYSHAIALSRQQLAVNPTNADLRAQMAFFLAKISSCADARENIGEALQLAPDRVAVAFESAKVAEACHNRESALIYLRSAIQKGYPLREIETDPDLTQLRQTPAYAAMRK